MQSQAPTDSARLYEFRETLDAIRLTAWTRHELMQVKQQKQDARVFLNLLASERLRRCLQLLDAICQDIDHNFLPAVANEVTSFYEELNLLRQRFAALLHRPSS